MKHLVELEQEALRLQNKGDFKEAVILFQKIVDEYPNFEFGSCFYSLAHCLEEIGEFEDAKKNYLKAIEYDDEDPTRLGGYASFLYLHGKPLEAFEKHVELIKLEQKQGFDFSNSLIALKTLGKKIGLTEDEVVAKIDEL